MTGSAPVASASIEIYRSWYLVKVSDGQPVTNGGEVAWLPPSCHSSVAVVRVVDGCINTLVSGGKPICEMEFVNHYKSIVTPDMRSKDRLTEKHLMRTSLLPRASLVPLNTRE